MSRYYDDDEDDNPYAPRIGPAAMPSPRSKFAPYYSGHANTFEDFLEEFEGLASNCELTDPQRVDVLIRYVAPSLRDFWRSLSGYHSRDWPLFRQSLVNIFGNTTPRHQILRQKLHSYIQDSSRRRMFCEDDVLRYYRQFICFGLPLVHAGHLSGEERDAAFWYGFHPDDRQILQPRLLGKNHFQPPDIPFHFEDVLGCARAAFAYEDSFSPWLHAKQFKPPIVRREQHIVEPAPRDAHSCRAVTRAVATYAETTPNELSPPSYSTPDSDFPHPLILPSESQHTQAPSVTLDLPETAHTLSTTLLPSASSPSHTSSPVHPATDNDLIPAYTFPITTSTLPPSVSPTPTHDSSLAHVAADVPEISSTPSPSITPAPLSMPMSDFEYLPSATVDQPEPAPTLSSTPPSSSISSTFLPSPARLATEDQSKPESTPTLFASVPTLTSTPTHVHSATDYGTIFASTPPSSSPTSPMLLPSPVTSATDFQPKSEPASESLVSKFGLFPRMLSFPPNQTFAPLSSSPLLEISTLGSLSVSLSPDQSIESLSFKSEALGQSSGSCELESTPASAADIAPPPVSTDSLVELYLSSPGELVPFLPASSETPPNAPISPHSTPPQRPPGLKIVGSDCSTLEVTPPHASSVPQQSQELSLVYGASSVFAPRPSVIYSSDSLRRTPARFGFALTLVTTAILSSFLNFSATLLRMRKFQSKIEDFGNSQIGTLNTSSRDVFAHRLRLGQYTPRAARFVFDPGGPASRSSFKLLSTHEDARKRMPKTRNNFITHVAIPIPVPIDNIIFDPGGGAFESEPAHEDVRKRNPKTCNGFTILDTSSPIPIPTDNLTVFDPGGVAFVLEPAHEDSTMFDEDARRLSLHARGHLSYYNFNSHFLHFRR